MEDIKILGQNLTGSVDAASFQGSVKQQQVFCKEMPFFINSNGDIAYRNPHDVIMDISFGRRRLAETIVRGLNEAYKLGYEYQRTAWV